MPRRIYEYRPGTDGGVREWPAEEQIWGHVHSGEQCALHQHAETQGSLIL
jgi:hypothetical protein